MKLISLLVTLFTIFVGQISNGHGSPAPSTTQPTPPSELDQAFQREYVFLLAQKRELEKQIGETNQRQDEKIRQTKVQLKKAQSQLVSLSMQADQLNGLYQEMERDAETSNEDKTLIESIISQSEATLNKHGIQKGKTEQIKSQAFKKSINETIHLLKKLSNVQKKKGEFFLQDGKKVRGELIQIGQIASFGLSSEGSGPLIPVGGGQFKLYERAKAQTIESIATTKGPDTLRLFLYESTDRPVPLKNKKNPLQVVQSGGIIAWVIVSLGMSAFVFVLLRYLRIRQLSHQPNQEVSQILSFIEAGNLKSAQNISQNGRTAVHRVLDQTITHLHQSRENLESALTESLIREEIHLDRFGTLILVLASIAPLLGLLGTVTGMISTFDVITEFGTGDPKLLSGGISEALVTTELGLIVAIPTLLLGSLLSGWSKRIKDSLEEKALRAINLYRICQKGEGMC